MTFKGFKIEQDETAKTEIYHITRERPFKVGEGVVTNVSYMGTIGQAVDYVNAIWKAEQAEKKANRTSTFDNEKYRANLERKRNACVAELEAAIEAKDQERFRTEWNKHRGYLTCKQAGPLYKRMIMAVVNR